MTISSAPISSSGDLPDGILEILTLSSSIGLILALTSSILME